MTSNITVYWFKSLNISWHFIGKKWRVKFLNDHITCKQKEDISVFITRRLIVSDCSLILCCRDGFALLDLRSQISSSTWMMAALCSHCRLSPVQSWMIREHYYFIPVDNPSRSSFLKLELVLMCKLLCLLRFSQFKVAHIRQCCWSHRCT